MCLTRFVLGELRTGPAVRKGFPLLPEVAFTDYNAIWPVTFRARFTFLFLSGGLWKGVGKLCLLPMSQGNRSVGLPDSGPFGRTRGSVVSGAAQGQAPGAPQALAELCARSKNPKAS
jgi:hypothetical protein